MPSTTHKPGVLFTAFEPSGDALAAPVIRRLRDLRPDIPIHALGGPKMRTAGAALIEESTQHAAMLLSAASKAFEHWGRVNRLRSWLIHNPIALHVPVDSPAANWSICKAVRSLRPGAKIVHLAAPQLWAWAPWRIRKMRRLSNHVLCLLPFEPSWFAQRGMPGTFVGHPIFDRPPITDPATDLGGGTPKLALLPGSRVSELNRNLPTMLRVVEALRSRHANLGVCVAAVDDRFKEMIERRIARTGRDADSAGFRIVSGRADEVIAWSDAVLVVSGTATLQVASHRKPMTAIYNMNRWSWELVGRWLIRTRTFTLPNLIGESLGIGRVCVELVPHFGDPAPAIAAVDALLTNADESAHQRALLEKVCGAFAGVNFTQRATDKLVEIAAL